MQILGADSAGTREHDGHLPVVRRGLSGLHVLHFPLHHVPPLPRRPCPPLLLPRHQDISKGVMGS
jgi:hypothetical protein